MKKIIVASKNPVKINATRKAFEIMFPKEAFEMVGVSVDSGAGHQPMTDADTFRGAWNRAEEASKEPGDPDFWVGIEGGVEDHGTEMSSFAWAVIKSSKNKVGKGRTATFFLPAKVAELVRQGKELGEADDIVFGLSNSKQKNGAVGILTDNAIDRTDYYIEAVAFALIPFKNESLY